MNNFSNDDTKELLNLYKNIEEYLIYLDSCIIIEEDNQDGD